MVLGDVAMEGATRVASPSIELRDQLQTLTDDRDRLQEQVQAVQDEIRAKIAHSTALQGHIADRALTPSGF